MHITVEPREQYSILHLRGEFDTYYCPMLQQEIASLQQAGVKHVVLNLRLVKFINSTALGAIIKASKELKGQSGGLAIARPSSFTRDVMDKVGLDRVVGIFETDEDAGASLFSTEAPTEVAPEEIGEDETAVIFSPVDSSRVEHFVEKAKQSPNPTHRHAFGSNWNGIGRMSGLDSEGMRFTWGGGKTGLTPFEMGQLLAIGTELKVKFRLPLLKKGNHEAVVTVSEVDERAEGVKIGATFTGIDDATRAAVSQYAEDLAFLKKELRQATGE